MNSGRNCCMFWCPNTSEKKIISILKISIVVEGAFLAFQPWNIFEPTLLELFFNLGGERPKNAFKKVLASNQFEGANPQWLLPDKL